MLLGVWAGGDCRCEVVVEVGIHGCTCCLAVAVGGRLQAVAPGHRREGVRHSLDRTLPDTLDNSDASPNQSLGIANYVRP